MKKTILLLSFILFSATLQSQIVRKYSNEFLNIGTGARGIGMGSSTYSSQDDVYAPMWNPAGLVNVSGDWQGAAMHAEYFESIAKYDYLAYAKGLESGGSFGISLVRLGIDNILDTTMMIDPDGNIDYDKIKSFSAADYAALVSYAFYPNQNYKLAVGVNAKLIYRNVGKFASGYGFGFDVGAIYSFQNNWKLGAVLKDAITTVNFWKVNQSKLSTVVEGNEFNPAPKDKMELTLPKLNISASRNFELNRDLDLLPEFGLNMEFQKTAALISNDAVSITPFAGAELAYDKMIFIRIGVNRFQNISDLDTNKQKVSFQPSAGLGIKYKGLTLDYAISNSGVGGSNFFSNFFSLKLDMQHFR